MDLLRGAGAIDVADGSLALAGDDAHRRAGRVAEAHTVAGPAGAHPHRDRVAAPAPAPHRQLVGVHEAPHGVVEEARATTARRRGSAGARGPRTAGVGRAR